MKYKKSMLSEQNLEKINPKLSKEWNYEKNGELKPKDVFANSHRKVWWKCKKGHIWEATIASRNKGRRCPICINRIILAGYNDLETLEPEIARLWNYEKNGELKPSQVSRKSNKKVWWKCPKGHEYELKINDKVGKRTGCPMCSNRIIIKGYNDLETSRPDLAGEWDKWRNKLSPSEVAPHSNKKVWWKCYRGHYWEARISDRTKKVGATNCPYCSKRRKWK